MLDLAVCLQIHRKFARHLSYHKCCTCVLDATAKSTNIPPDTNLYRLMRYMEKIDRPVTTFLLFYLHRCLFKISRGRKFQNTTGIGRFLWEIFSSFDGVGLQPL